MSLGYPSAGQALWLVEHAMDNVMPQALTRVQQILCVLEGIECSMVESIGRLRAQQVGEVKLRNTNDEALEPDLLEREYCRWAKRLSDHLGAPLNPFSERYRGGGSMSTPVAPP